MATRNAHKLAELSALLAPRRLEALPDDVALPPETGDTFAANALEKARCAARVLRRATIADDSGIEAAALGGAPGVRSARFAGEGATDADNLAKLLRELERQEDRRAAYVCVLAYADGSDERCFTGRCEGTLASVPRGGGGFGYDPAFVPDDVDDGRTMAELARAEKDAISHRGLAGRALLRWLAQREAGQSS